MSTDPATDGTSTEPIAANYETAVAELEALVVRMESGNLALEETLVAYQRGVALIRYCREHLISVDQRVRILEAGMLEPFDADPGAGRGDGPGAESGDEWGQLAPGTGRGA